MPAAKATSGNQSNGLNIEVIRAFLVCVTAFIAFSRTLKQLWQYLSSEGRDVRTLMERIVDVILKAIIWLVLLGSFFSNDAMLLSPVCVF